MFRTRGRARYWLCSGQMMHAAPANAQVAALVENSQIEPRYVRPTNPRYVAIYNRLVQRRVLEELKQFLAALRLPRKLVVQFDTCGAENRPYQPGGAVTVCYELIDRIEKLAAENAKDDADMRQMAVVGGVRPGDARPKQRMRCSMF